MTGKPLESEKKGKVYSYEERQELALIEERKMRQLEAKFNDPRFEIDNFNNEKN